MKTILLILISIASTNFASADTNEMHYYDAANFIFDHLKLPAVGETKDMQDSKVFNSVIIRKKFDKYGWPHITFQSTEGSFFIDKHVDPGLFEKLSSSPQVQNGHANSILVSCKYLIGQQEKNWFSPFVPRCTLSF